MISQSSSWDPKYQQQILLESYPNRYVCTVQYVQFNDTVVVPPTVSLRSTYI